MSPETLFFYADRIRKFCNDSDGCSQCPFFIKEDCICNFYKNDAPYLWEVPEKEADNVED